MSPVADARAFHYARRAQLDAAAVRLEEQLRAYLATEQNCRRMT